MYTKTLQRILRSVALFSPAYIAYFQLLLTSGSSLVSLLTELLMDLSLQLFRVTVKRQVSLCSSAVSCVLTHLNAKEAGQQPKDQQVNIPSPCLFFDMGLLGWLRQGGSSIRVDDNQTVWSATLHDSGRFLAPTLLFMSMGQGCRGQQFLLASVFATAFPFALSSQLRWSKVVAFCLSPFCPT